MSCDHQRECVTDHRTATVVCADCALVLDQGLSYNELHAISENLHHAPLIDSRSDVEKNVREFVYDVCCRLQVSDKYFNETLEKYKKLNKENTKFRKIDISMYCLYKTLLEYKIPKSLHHISICSNIPTRNIFLIEKYFNEKYVYFDPKSLLSTFYIYLDLDYDDLRNLHKMCDDLKIFRDFQPKTVG